MFNFHSYQLYLILWIVNFLSICHGMSKLFLSSSKLRTWYYYVECHHKFIHWNLCKFPLMIYIFVQKKKGIAKFKTKSTIGFINSLLPWPLFAKTLKYSKIIMNSLLFHVDDILALVIHYSRPGTISIYVLICVNLKIPNLC